MHLDETFRTTNLHDYHIDENCIPWLYSGCFQQLVFNLKMELKKIHKTLHKMDGYQSCMYLYVNLTYYNSLKTYEDFRSTEFYGMRQGNIKDFLVFLQAIVYIGSGDFHRKTSHCSSAEAHKYKRKTKPQTVHTNILEQIPNWNLRILHQ